MTIPCSIKDLESKKYFDPGIDDEPAVRVGGTGSLVEGIIFDAITGEETAPTIETYRYYRGGTGGTLVATIVVTYSNASKNFVLSAVRTPVVP